MKVTDFSVLIAEKEGGKKSVSIAQIKEVLKITRDIILEKSGTDIYKVIRKM